MPPWPWIGLWERGSLDKTSASRVCGQGVRVTRRSGAYKSGPLFLPGLALVSGLRVRVTRRTDKRLSDDEAADLAQTCWAKALEHQYFTFHSELAQIVSNRMDHVSTEEDKRTNEEYNDTVHEGLKQDNKFGRSITKHFLE